MGDLPDEKLTSEGFVPKILREWAADALLISYIASIPPKLIDLIAQHHIPSIWLNTKLAADCVFPDDVDAGQRATKHLLDLGHHKIAYLYPIDSSHYSVTDRRDGYLKAMRRAKVKPQMFGYEGSGVSMRWNEVSQAWLAKADRPTAVVAYAANYAIPVLCAALELGLKVPRDLSLIVMHEAVVLEPGFPMTTMLIPTEELGRTAVEMVLTKLENPLAELKPQAITFGFEAGTTCSPPLKAK
jgi:LacI family transcriptional regulator